MRQVAICGPPFSLICGHGKMSGIQDSGIIAPGRFGDLSEMTLHHKQVSANHEASFTILYVPGVNPIRSKTQRQPKMYKSTKRPLANASNLTAQPFAPPDFGP